MIQELAYAASLAYSPRGQSEVSAKSRRYMASLKRADPEFLIKAAGLVARQVAEGQFPGFFGEDVTLVPVPGSAPRVDANSLWVGAKLAQALLAQGLASQLWMPLQRGRRVRKSATAGPGERPNVQTHIDSFDVTDRLPPRGPVLLVDDIVTKGATLLAAACALNDAVPGLELRGFALIRTMGLQLEIERIVEPVVGSIGWLGDVDRTP